MPDDRYLLALETLRERLCAKEALLDEAGDAMPDADGACLAARTAAGRHLGGCRLPE